MEEEITLSDNYGLNPTLDICPLCGKSHQILLLGKLPNDEPAPTNVCTGQVCKVCTDKLEENKERIYIEWDNNYLTGRYAKVPDKNMKDEYLKKIGDKRVFHIQIDNFNKVFND